MKVINYPKTLRNRRCFSVYGDIYYEVKYPGVFENACATRVSIALIESEMYLRKDFMVQKGKHAGRGFIASARGLKEWLFNSAVWGPPDETIPGRNTLAKVAEIIDGRNGIYIILNDGNKQVKDHATLWLGDAGDVIGKRNQIGKGGTIYFWELKDASPAVEEVAESKCTYSKNKPDCGSQNKSQIHEILGCKHYSGIRKLLEEGLPSDENNDAKYILSEDELFVFNFLEEYMSVKLHNSGKFSFNEENGSISTDIEKDAVDRFNRLRYQSTIHELWHNMDIIAGIGIKFGEC